MTNSIAYDRWQVANISALLLSALTLAGCVAGTPTETTSTSDDPAALRQAAPTALAALDRAGRRPLPAGMRLVPPDEVKAHFARVARARELARAEEANPANVDQLLTKLGNTTDAKERMIIADDVMHAMKQMPDSGARATTLEHLNEVWAATQAH